MTDPAESSPRGGSRRDRLAALNALDLALASQRIDAEMTEFLSALLPLLDGVEKLCRGLASQPADALAAKAEPIGLLAELADEALDQIGLSRFGAVGETVDRARHEVVETVPDPQRAPGTVVDVVEPGWIYQGIPLRHAKVIASVKRAGNT
jgi:molecular chaperone GrpE